MANLLDLPEELLNRICEFATDLSPGTGRSLLRTNKQLHRIASAIIYRHLVFSSNTTGHGRSADGEDGGRCSYVNTRFERYLRASIAEPGILMQLRSLRLFGTVFRQCGSTKQDRISQLANLSREDTLDNDLAEYRARWRKKSSLFKPTMLRGEGQALCIAAYRLAQNLNSLCLDGPSFQDLTTFAHLAEADILQKRPKLKRLILLGPFIPHKWHINDFWKYILEIESLEELAIAKIIQPYYSPLALWPGASPPISPNTRLSNLRVLRLGRLFKDGFRRGPHWILPSCRSLEELSLEFIGGWKLSVENFSFLIDTIYIAQECCRGLKTLRLLDDLDFGPPDDSSLRHLRCSPLTLTDARARELLHARLSHRTKPYSISIKPFNELTQLQVSAHTLLFLCIFMDFPLSTPANGVPPSNCFDILPDSLQTIIITECGMVTAPLLSDAVAAQLDRSEFPPLHSVEATICTEDPSYEELRSEEGQCWKSFRRLRRCGIDFRLTTQQGRSKLDFWDSI